MNIYQTSECPRRAAQDLDDYLLCRSIDVVATHLSTACRSLAPDQMRNLPLRPMALERSPISLWVRSSWEAFNYALEHGLALLSEYHERFPMRKGLCSGQAPIHAVLGSSRSVVQPRMFRPQSSIAAQPTLTNQAVDGELNFTAIASPTAAYRMLLAARWGRLRKGENCPSWTNAVVPEWFPSALIAAEEAMRAQGRRVA